MTIRNLSEVGARLEKIVAASINEYSSPLETYELYESVAIAILDSEFDDYPEGELERYLMEYLKHKELELNISLKHE
jgi:hypothetical protein